ncbi:MAG TPA: M20/M25/M40 family metallo-hydrolase [Bacteroidales bacterium]|nr:M20/M25/M40 family metallo-hydrolase [Bacteroidales bacterium]
MKRTLSLTGLLIVILIIGSCRNQSGTNPNITSQELMSAVEYFASDKLSGRLAGSEEYNEAARYVAREFKKYGLSNAGFEDYFQWFTLEYNEIRDASFSITTSDSTRSYQLGKDYICRGFSGSGKVEAPVVFCGYGLSRPEMGYDDFAGVDVEGKIVMEFKSDPRWRLDGKRPGYRSLRKKVDAARDHGALAIMYVSQPNDNNPQKPIGSVMHGRGKQSEDFPQIHVSLEVAKRLFQDSRHTLKELQTAIDKEHKPYSVELPGKAKIMVDALYEPKKPSMNVVGLIEGDSLRNEYLIVGAHLDHVGEQAGEVIFPGANDNASGVATLMEVAEAMAMKEAQPARSVLFVAFSAEEQGLNGARYFVDHIPVDKDKVVAMMNFDCVAHGDSIVVGGGRSFPELYGIAKDQDKAGKQMIIDRTWGGGGADATPFFEQGIPTLYFATKNSYDYLHQPGDKPQTLNAPLHQYLTEIGYKTAMEIAAGRYTRPEKDN